MWEANNRLAQLKINGQTTAVYGYDAQGRRVEASISTSNNGAAQTNTVQYIYEGNQAVGEVRNDQLSDSLLTGLFIDEHLVRTAIATNGQIQNQAQLTDALGSVIALANAQTSSINTSYSYSPYGQTQATGENSSNNQQYTGREAGVEGEAGLYYYRARYYDPVLKRFISEDPIRLEGGLNVYQYVEGMPTMATDPMGLDTLKDGAGKYHSTDSMQYEDLKTSTDKYACPLLHLKKCNAILKKLNLCSCAETAVSYGVCMACCSTGGGYLRSGGGSCHVGCMDKFPKEAGVQ